MASRPKAPLSYAASLTVPDPVQAAASTPSLPEATSPREHDEETGRIQVRGRRPLEEKADPSVLYLHPEGKKVLRLYAVEKGVKVHDLLLEALEQWAADRGLRGPWRVPSAGPPRRHRP